MATDEKSTHPSFSAGARYELEVPNCVAPGRGYAPSWEAELLDPDRDCGFRSEASFVGGKKGR